jgi:hypothetical protein
VPIQIAHTARSTVRAIDGRSACVAIPKFANPYGSL